MWNFNQNQGDNSQNQNLGWNVNNANAGGGENYALFAEPSTSVFLSTIRLSFIFKGGYNAGTPNFGWNLNAPIAAPSVPMPMPPEPHYDTQTHQYDGEPGVEEVVASKNAGSMSFAHYIVRWVSGCLLSFFIHKSHDSCWILSFVHSSPKLVQLLSLTHTQTIFDSKACAKPFYVASLKSLSKLWMLFSSCVFTQKTSCRVKEK